MKKQYSFFTALMVSAGILLPLPLQVSYAETLHFGIKTPTVDEFVTNLAPKPRFRGIRPAAKETSPPTVSMNIKFAFDSYELNSSSRETLDNLSAALKSPELASSTFIIEGHTDATGSPEYNQVLSEKRAMSVKEYLVKKGVKSSQLSTLGKGEDGLLDTSKPNDGVNRRVAVVNIGGR
ncbi:MAG: OmpA family protein [Gammaproteobacteria bacterium]